MFCEMMQELKFQESEFLAFTVKEQNQSFIGRSEDLNNCEA